MRFQVRDDSAADAGVGVRSLVVVVSSSGTGKPRLGFVRLWPRLKCNISDDLVLFSDNPSTKP